MKKIIIFIILAAVVLGVMQYVDREKVINFSDLGKKEQYEFVSPYVDRSGDFTFMVPKAFSIVKKDEKDREVFMINSEDGTEGIQIVITDYPENIDVTADFISRIAPDLKIKEPQVVEVGESRKGLAFLSENEAWDGGAREVWFIWNNRFYQITTYEYSEDLIKGFFETWQLKKR